MAEVTAQRVAHLPLITGWLVSDWQEIFWSSRGLGEPPPAPEDVEEVLYQFTTDNGSDDYQDTDMVAVVRLKGGKFATVHAGNDTTGWGCQGDYVDWRRANDLDDAITFGLTAESRRWLGLEVEHEF